VPNEGAWGKLASPNVAVDEFLELAAQNCSEAMVWVR
jgi:hypothetical protein